MWNGQAAATMFGPRGQFGDMAVPNGLQQEIAASLSDPFKQGRRAVMLELRGMRTDVGNFFEKLPEALEGFSIADLIANQQAQYDLENRMSNMMQTAGALGLDNLVASLGELSGAEWQTLFNMGLTMADIIQLGLAAGDLYAPSVGGYSYNTGTYEPGGGGGGGGGGGAPSVTVHAAGSILSEGGLVSLIEDAVIRIMGRGGRSSPYQHTTGTVQVMA
jgi:hypothetical protein